MYVAYYIMIFNTSLNYTYCYGKKKNYDLRLDENEVINFIAINSVYKFHNNDNKIFRLNFLSSNCSLHLTGFQGRRAELHGGYPQILKMNTRVSKIMFKSYHLIASIRFSKKENNVQIH